MEFHFLHNIFTDSAFLFNTFKILHVDKSKKIGCTKLLRLWGSHIYIYICVCVCPFFPMSYSTVCWGAVWYFPTAVYTRSEQII